MSRAYTKWTCWFCQQANISGNGLAVTSHLRKHVREGKLREVRSYHIKDGRRDLRSWYPRFERV